MSASGDNNGRTSKRRPASDKPTSTHAERKDNKPRTSRRRRAAVDEGERSIEPCETRTNAIERAPVGCAAPTVINDADLFKTGTLCTLLSIMDRPDQRGKAWQWWLGELLTLRINRWSILTNGRPLLYDVVTRNGGLR